MILWNCTVTLAPPGPVALKVGNGTRGLVSGPRPTSRAGPKGTYLGRREIRMQAWGAALFESREEGPRVLGPIRGRGVTDAGVEGAIP